MALALVFSMWVMAARSAALSVITGGGKWVDLGTFGAFAAFNENIPNNRHQKRRIFGVVPSPFLGIATPARIVISGLSHPTP
jgi:hypothetical protein